MQEIREGRTDSGSVFAARSSANGHLLAVKHALIRHRLKINRQR
jgi:hypothetical protein